MGSFLETFRRQHVQGPGSCRSCCCLCYQSAPYTPYANDAYPRDAQASGSNAYSAPIPNAGPDHVDYGAYTGGYGAFGWYNGHPVLLAGHHSSGSPVMGGYGQYGYGYGPAGR